MRNEKAILHPPCYSKNSLLPDKCRLKIEIKYKRYKKIYKTILKFPKCRCIDQIDVNKI